MSPMMILQQALIVWSVLLLTGRIYDKFSSDTEKSTWGEDAAAAAVVVGATAIFSAVCWLGMTYGYPIPRQLIGPFYFWMIYRVYQLEGLRDLVYFFLLHVAVALPLIFLSIWATTGFRMWM